MTKKLEFKQKFGYICDREQHLFNIAPGEASLAFEAASQIKHLKGALKELVVSVEAHRKLTEHTFSVNELEQAKIALGGNND